MLSELHFILGTRIQMPFPEHTEHAIFGLGCFWGAERCFWQLSDIYSTMVGYGGGENPNPSYQDVCTGTSGHCELVGVVYYPEQISYYDLLKVFWQAHDPTQGMRQGNDIGSQYRSAIYTTTEKQYQEAVHSCSSYQQALNSAGYGTITTEVKVNPQFYYAEDYHQQYLAKNPGGYCGLSGLGVAFNDA